MFLERKELEPQVPDLAQRGRIPREWAAKKRTDNIPTAGTR
jgi:hypothetical protein